MGRRKTNFVHKYFIYDEQQNRSTCAVDDCGVIIKGNHGTNLLKHMKKHPMQYKLILEDKENREENQEHDKGNKEKKSKQDVKIKLMEECVNLVTTCGRPLTLIDDKPFQNILDMAMAGTSRSSINSHNIREATQNKADHLRDAISSIMKDKLLSLKLDIASCHLRSFLGINLQFVENGQINIKTLSVTELTQRHTAEFLKDQLIYVLYRYRISIPQIYSVTTDNGANMLKMVKLVDQTLKNSINENGDDSDNEENEIIERDEVNFILEDYLESEHYTVAAVRCAAHTLQLAVQDALGSESSLATMLINAREVVKKLRTTVFQHVLKSAGAKKPVVDCPTRWSSTYDMLKRLLELRLICTENYELYLSESTWNSIEATVGSLKPTKILTQKLQIEQLTMGDFYLNWIRCKLELQTINTALACELHRNMEIREKILFESKAFVAAIYMDPRVNFLLTTDQQEMAENMLINTWMRWRKLNKNVNKSTVTSLNIESPAASSSTQQRNEGGMLEDFLNQSYGDRLQGDASYGCAIDNIDIKTHLNDFLNKQVRLPASENILIFWETKKDLLPQLYTLSNIVLAAPSTQVSVERLFSSLNYVFNKLRTKLKSDLVEDILFIRNNSGMETTIEDHDGF